MKKGFISKRQTGFTLIELMIVIAIIGILSTIFVNASFINIKKGRDARRKSDLELIRSGIETYRADCNVYPASISFGGQLKGDNSYPGCKDTNIYISAVPSDPISTNAYVYTISGDTYQICASLEAPSGTPVSYSCNGSVTSCGGTCNYQVTSP